MASQIVEEYGDERAAEALQQGMQQGAQQKAIETAKNALALNLSPEIVSKISELSLEKVLELQKQL